MTHRPDPTTPDLVALLNQALAQPGELQAQALPPLRLRERLAARAAAGRQAEARLHTQRLATAPAHSPQPGVTQRLLYAGPGQRLGEPLRVERWELAPGTQVLAAAPMLAGAGLAELALLVLSGTVRCGGVDLGPPGAQPPTVLAALDHLHLGAAPTLQAGPAGAVLLLRWARPLGAASGDGAGSAPALARELPSAWADYGPGIRRRVLWSAQGQAAMLYQAEAGAQVPRHQHGHDEECLMLQGELFLDDLLLQTGDYQLAPAGTGHQLTHTDTGVLIYAHGDLDLQFV